MPDLPMIHQGESGECGLACLAMVAAHHGSRVELRALRDAAPCHVSGTTLRELVDTAASIDLAPRAVTLDVNELSNLQLPAILHWDFNHFVVLRRVGPRSAVIHNPAAGIRKYRLSEVDGHFTGVAIELEPTPDFPRASSEDRRLRLRDLCTGLTGLPSGIVKVLLLSFLLQSFAMASPLYLQLVVDEVIMRSDGDLLTVLAAGFLALAFLTTLTKTIRGLAVMYLSQRLAYNILARLYSHLIRLPLSFFQRRHTGDLVSRFTSIGPVRDFISNSTIAIILDTVTTLVAVTVMLLFSSSLTGLVLGSLVLYGLLQMGLAPTLRERSMQQVMCEANQQTAFLESIRAVQPIKLFGKEPDQVRVWQSRVRETLDCERRQGKLNITLDSASTLIRACENVLVVYLGARSIEAGSLTVGTLYAFVAYRSHLSSAVSSLCARWLEYQLLALHLERIADIALSEPERDEGDALSLDMPIDGTITVRDLSFQYAPALPMVLSQVTVDIDKGDLIAICGPSGAGKSTLISLMQGILDPTEGRIEVDGRALHHVGRRVLRSSIVAVMHTDQLLMGTVADNISFRDVGKDRQRIEAAARGARVHDVIARLPRGYDTEVGEFGTVLSAGQAQRILIARALYAEPRILLLDEGLGHLHQSVAEEILRTIRDLGITCLFTTHRSALVRLTDGVITVSRGTASLKRRPGTLG